MGWLDTLLSPIEFVVAWIMFGWHQLLTRIGLPSDAGVTWALSIVGLVIVIRILLIPLFVRQINASRAMQLIQPEVKKIQDKYRGKSDQASREAMTKEMMTLYKESKTNPFASCMPILLQSPIFFALFRVLNAIAHVSDDPQHVKTIGPLSVELMKQANQATLFGTPLSDTFSNPDTPATRVFALILIVLMSITSFITQRQLMTKNMPESALTGQYAKQQKILLYAMPIIFAISGVAFPIGVLLYWLTTNIWSMGQQFYVIHRMPAPGSPAERALKERQRRNALASGEAKNADSKNAEPGNDELEDEQPARQQPKRAPRSKRKKK